MNLILIHPLIKMRDWVSLDLIHSMPSVDMDGPAYVARKKKKKRKTENSIKQREREENFRVLLWIALLVDTDLFWR